MCYRVNDTETAEFFSDLAGEIEAQKINKSVSPAVRENGSTYYKNTFSSSVEAVPLVPVEKCYNCHSVRCYAFTRDRVRLLMYRNTTKTRHALSGLILCGWVIWKI